MKKDLSHNLVFGQKKGLLKITCQEDRNLLDKINQSDSPDVGDIVKTMEHTRECSECANYLINLQKK